jgi:uncharacterized protein (TIGR03067 family)
VDRTSLQGEWRLTALTQDGVVFKEAQFRNRRLQIAGDRFTFLAGTNVQFAAKMTLDPTWEPREIDLDLDGPGYRRSVLGIYALDGDELKLCLPQPGRDRPATFTSPEKTGTALLVFQREKP